MLEVEAVPCQEGEEHLLISSGQGYDKRQAGELLWGKGGKGVAMGAEKKGWGGRSGEGD